MKKISVIIAAYNAAKFLSETLDSIFSQTMQLSEYEVIVINDGSTDTTLDILNAYKEEYSELVIIDKENGGPSSARNVGLDVAGGEYIFFYDADDILAPDALTSLYDTAESHNAELVIGKYDMFDEYRVMNIHNLDKLVALEEIDKYNTDILWTFSLSNKLFRRDLIKKYSLKLPPISYSEDGVFVMEYLYHCEKITGLDEIITHYRRYTSSDATSITSSVSGSKIKDYITAHQMILESAQRSFLRDYPQYTSIEEAVDDNAEIRNYLNSIIRKELQIILSRFYGYFWSLDEDTVQMMIDEINSKLRRLDMQTSSLLSSDFPEYSLYNMKVSQEEVLKNAFFTAVLYGDESNEKDFLACLESLTQQNLIFIKIVIPFAMKKAVEAAQLVQGNIIFEKCESKNELFAAALEKASTPYITFCDAKFIYTQPIFKKAVHHFTKAVDFFAEVIYHREYGDLQPCVYSKIAARSLCNGYGNNPLLWMDATFANKFFRIDFIRKLHLDFSLDANTLLSRCYETGKYAYYFDALLIYNDRQETFIAYIGTEETLPFLKEYLKDKPITLNSKDILYNPSESGMKFRNLPEDNEEAQKWQQAFLETQETTIKNQVAFVSVRSDKKLEGNARSLYPFVKGKKIICANRLPHDEKAAVSMIKEIFSSKVIVTDDYVKYLRYFPLRKEQRVIQLWHACGAFKKFGQRGTNMSLPEDRATHAQYNLVCVSGENLRDIYADAFDVNYNKVKALGVPRTDDYFNKKLINKIKRKIYFHHPSFLRKSIIVYAPTFRDVGCDRSDFQPELDFDRLSKDLLPNQLLLICPHPVMKNKILPKNYHNIRVMRDFSTNDYMLISDMLITDYSSVIFEYALLKKPIAFFCYDLASYDRGFYLKYPEDLPGDIYTTQEELTRYLQNTDAHVATDKLNLFTERYMSACDGHSCERIANLINSYMKEH